MKKEKEYLDELFNKIFKILEIKNTKINKTIISNLIRTHKKDFN